MPQSPDDVFRELRQLALKARPDALGLSNISADAAFGVLMDMPVSNGVASIVAFRSGEASIYLSSGGGFIGGFRHEAVRRAALRFVDIASGFTTRMERVSAFPLPEAEFMSFYALLIDRILFAKALQADLFGGRSPFTPLFSAGQDVITAYRQIDGPPK